VLERLFKDLHKKKAQGFEQPVPCMRDKELTVARRRYCPGPVAQRLFGNQQHLLVTRAGVEPEHGQIGEGGSKYGFSLPISSTTTASLLRRAGKS
jgi:hypothetical protein